MCPANMTLGSASGLIDATEFPVTSEVTASAKVSASLRQTLAGTVSNPDGPGASSSRFRKASEAGFMREITDSDGRVWTAGIASHGRTSDYLNPRVHRPIVEFSCKSAGLPRRYASLPLGHQSLDELTTGELSKLLGDA